ncbi:MAG: cation diffusion facilitator family transporter [Bacilli bacterium]|nr:cation diffusion facilitator family transporter [Bacilli bacterium]
MLKRLGRIFIRDYNNVENATVRNQYGVLCAWYGVITNIIIAIGKMILGFIMGSIAVLADGVNNLMDSASSIITIISFKLSLSPADSEHPYGHQRMEYVGSLVVSFIMFAVGFFFFQSSLSKIITPTAIDLSQFWWMIAILGASILIKVSQWFLYKEGERLISSLALRATAQDSANDILITTTVLLSMVVFRLTQFNIDGIIGLLVSLVILYNAFVLIKNTVSILLGEAPDSKIIQVIREKLEAYPNVLGIHDLLIHSYGPKKTFITVHVEVDAHENIMKSHEMIDGIEQDFLEKEGWNMVIHMDPVDMSDEKTLELKAITLEIMSEIDPRVNIHDFRRTKGNKPKILFDVLVPSPYDMKEDALKEIIIAKMKQKIEKYTIIITIDQHYY